jgi:hypothetical protein
MAMEFDRAYRAALWTIDRVLFRRLFSLLERTGFHVTPVHFYQPIPDTRTMKESLWSRQSQLVGININEQRQIELIGQFLRFKHEYDAFPRRRASRPWQFYANNPNFGPVDAEMLYCMIRHFRPRKVVEIGCGYSTYLLAEALRKNEEETGHQAELIAVDLHPGRVLKSGFPGLSRLIPQRVEEVDLAEFEALEENDILSIDSSHVLRIGGDVHHEYLEILPRLSKGVIVHIHDVFLPSEYPRRWVLQMHRFWNEQYLAQAFLAFNGAFEIVWCGSYMHVKHPDKLAEAFASYDQSTVWATDRPGATSLWIRKTV